MEYSDFAYKFSQKSGIAELMKDLDLALNRPHDKPVYFLGGGNPARIEAVEAILEQSAREAISGDFGRLAGLYDNPTGSDEFRQSLAAWLKEKHGWDISADMIALTNGSQNSFFLLFNAFAGESRGKVRRILFPYSPEYIGYADLAVSGNLFYSLPSLVEEHSDDGLFFRYRLDFDTLEATLKERDDIGMMGFSRPSNPTGQLADRETIYRLNDLGRQYNVPVLIDSAYGYPFPGITYEESAFEYRPGMIITMSLSKFGLPGGRTGIVIADKEVITLMGQMNAILNLSGNSFGPAIGSRLLDTDRMSEVVEHCRSVYTAKKEHALQVIRQGLEDFPRLKGLLQFHLPEGAFFMWARVTSPGLSESELYEALKAANVFVVPGHYYFFGDHPIEQRPVSADAAHFRISYSQSDEAVSKGLYLFMEQLNALV